MDALNLLIIAIAGLPPPSVDIISILKKPMLYNKPLYCEDNEGKKERNSDFDAFCRAMGWKWNDDVIPSKSDQNKHRVFESLSIENVHKTFGKTNVQKEMAESVLKGVERKEAVEKVSDKKAAKLRKVNKKKYWVSKSWATEIIRHDEIFDSWTRFPGRLP